MGASAGHPFRRRPRHRVRRQCDCSGARNVGRAQRRRPRQGRGRTDGDRAVQAQRSPPPPARRESRRGFCRGGPRIGGCFRSDTRRSDGPARSRQPDELSGRRPHPRCPGKLRGQRARHIVDGLVEPRPIVARGEQPQDRGIPDHRLGRGTCRHGDDRRVRCTERQVGPRRQFRRGPAGLLRAYGTRFESAGGLRPSASRHGDPDDGWCRRHRGGRLRRHRRSWKTGSAGPGCPGRGGAGVGLGAGGTGSSASWSLRERRSKDRDRPRQHHSRGGWNGFCAGADRSRIPAGVDRRQGTVFRRRRTHRGRLAGRRSGRAAGHRQRYPRRHRKRHDRQRRDHHRRPQGRRLAGLLATVGEERCPGVVGRLALRWYRPQGPVRYQAALPAPTVSR